MNTEKQPLQIVDSLVYRLSDPDGSNVDEVNVTMWEGHRNSAKRQQGARRVKACIDACEGIDTETLEVTHGLDAIYNHIQNQRDVLRAALNLIADGEVMDGAFTHADTILAYQQIARTAIEKAEKQLAQNADFV